MRIPRQGPPGNNRSDNRDGRPPRGGTPDGRPGRPGRPGGPSSPPGRPGPRGQQRSRDRSQQGGDRPGPRTSSKKLAPPIRIKGELLYGRNAILEALRGPRSVSRMWIADGVREDDRVSELVELGRHRQVEIDTVPRRLLDDLTEGANHQGIGLEAAPFGYADLEDIIEAKGTILVLDHLHDPQNFGTLIRAGDAAGIAGIVLPSDRSVSVTPAVVNASAGAVEHLNVTVVPNLGRALDKIESSGRWIVGLDSGDDARDLFDTDLPTPIALVVGSEGPGLTRNIRERCQLVVSLPMLGKVASLNAATAGSIALFDILRRERPSAAE